VDEALGKIDDDEQARGGQRPPRRLADPNQLAAVAFDRGDPQPVALAAHDPGRAVLVEQRLVEAHRRTAWGAVQRRTVEDVHDRAVGLGVGDRNDAEREHGDGGYGGHSAAHSCIVE
jgi:hypothetical protein